MAKLDCVLFLNQVSLGLIAADFSDGHLAAQGRPTRTSRAFALIRLAIHNACAVLTGSFSPMLKSAPAKPANVPSKNENNAYKVIARLLMASSLMQGALVASAADTVIDFEDFDFGTFLSNEYHNLGVDFITGGNFFGVGNDLLPVVRPVPPGQAQSGRNVANISTCVQCIGEFYSPTAGGIFTTYKSHVQVSVGLFQSDLGDGNAEVILRAFDVDFNLIQSDSVTVTAGAGFHSLLSVSSPAKNIAYFDVSAPSPFDLNQQLGIDDLTFDSPEIPAAPDFNLAVSPISAQLTPDGTPRNILVTINRFNGSTGKINFEVSGLPIGITWTFSETPTDTGPTLTLRSSPDVGKTATLATITATPVDSSAGSRAKTIQVGVYVEPSFILRFVRASADLPNCSTIQIPLTLTRSTFQSQALSVSFNAINLPAGVEALFNPPVVEMPAGTYIGVNTISLALVSRLGEQIPDDFDLTVEAQGGGQTSRGVVRIRANIIRIDSVSPARGETPHSLRPGTEVTLRGAGFCGNFLVKFGNQFAIVQPTPFAVNSDGTEVVVRVPRLATDGFPTGPSLSIVALPDASHPTSREFLSRLEFKVQSYRNTEGFAFRNYSESGFGFDDVEELFGYEATHVSINLCWPFFDCSFTTPIPDPLAALFAGIADQALQDGQCNGIAQASQRLLHGDILFSTFPLKRNASVATVWNLADFDNPSAPLKHYIHIQHLAQLSAEFLHHWLANSAENLTAGSDHIYDQIFVALALGDHPLVSIRDGSKGHVVVAYDLERTGIGTDDFFIYVYDPNVQFESGENFDAVSHRNAEGYTDVSGVDHGSRIHVNADNTWSLPNNGWGGGLDTIVVVPYGVVPSRPKGAWTLDGFTSFIFGSAETAQISDNDGRNLFLENGSPNPDATARPQVARFAPLEGTPALLADIYVLGTNGPYKQTIRGLTNGTYEATTVGNEFGVRLLNVETVPRIDDILEVAPRLASVRFQTEASVKTLNAQLMARTAQGIVRTITLTTKSFARGSDGLNFDESREHVTYKHAGTATEFTLEMSQVDSDGVPRSFTTGPLLIRDDETAVFSPTDWFNLPSASVTLTVTSTFGETSRILLQSCPSIFNGCVGWWQGENSATDNSGAGNSGTIMNGLAFESGKVGQAFSFDGVDDYIAIPNNSTLTVTDQLTVEAWIRPEDVTSYRQIFSKFGTEGNYAYQFGIAPGGILRLDVSGDGKNYQALTSPEGILNVDDWAHVAGTFNQGILRLFWNGSPIAETVTSTTSIFNEGTTSPSIGRDPVGIQYFAGMIDELGVYNRVLSSEEIETIYGLGSRGKCGKRLQILKFGRLGNSVRIEWQAEAGVTYRLQYKSDLSEARWNDLPGDVTADALVASKIDDTVSLVKQRFYRVLQLNPP